MILLAITLGLLPSFAWLIFFLKEDNHPEPKKLIVKVFLAGAFITLAAVTIQFAFLKIFNQYATSEHGLLPFFAYASIEEIFKFLAAYFVVRKSKYFDEPIDAMIYMITSALGFAAVENILAAVNMIDSRGIDGVFGLLVLRFIGATLLHALSSGIFGYYWAKSRVVLIENTSIFKGLILVKGMIIAVILHTFFNYLILVSNRVFIVPTIFLVIIALFVFSDFEKIKT